MNEEQQLLDSYLDGELSPEEQDRLAGWLAADAEHVRQFVRETSLHRQIRETMLARPYHAYGLSEIECAKPKETPSLTGWFTRPWGQLFALPWSPVLRGALALTACLLGLACLSIWWFGAVMGEPVLTGVKGVDASVERGTEFIPAANGMALQPADVLWLGTNASATIAFGAEKSRLELNGGTELKLVALARGKRFVLGSGKIKASVARQRPFQPMVLVTPQAEARVIGTEFTLSATTNATRLEVTEGKVKFTRKSDDAAVKVPAGYYVVAATTTELAVQPLTGSILREYWTNLPGAYFITTLTSHPNYPDHPSGREYLDKFEAPSHWGTNYGARIRGYLHPPKTGEYTFWIAVSDGGELWLSPDDDPNHRQEIGYAKPSAPHEWTNQPGQQSSAITLVAGRYYYIEALQKQGGEQADHLAVAWHGPGRNLEVIPGEFLSPLKPKPKGPK